MFCAGPEGGQGQEGVPLLGQGKFWSAWPQGTCPSQRPAHGGRTGVVLTLGFVIFSLSFQTLSFPSWLDAKGVGILPACTLL